MRLQNGAIIDWKIPIYEDKIVEKILENFTQ